MINNVENYNKWFLIYLIVLIITILFIMPHISLNPDNGTHALLSLFYKNLAELLIRNKEFSFKKIYDFGIAYLVHYPKLQVFYPPLYHIITGLVFYTIFGISAWSAGFCNLVFGVLTLCTLYVLVMKIFDSKTALIAVILFSLFPFMLTLTGRAMMEYTAMFFLSLSLLIYFEIKSKKKKRYYVFLALVTVLAVLSKRAAFFVLPVYFLHLLYKKKWKYAMVFLVTSILLLIPYGFIILKVGGLNISSIIWKRYAFENFVWYFFFEYPFLFIFFTSFIYYLLKSKDKNKSILGMWFFVFLIGMLLISFKYRYFTYFLIPTFIITANYLSKSKVLIFLFIFFYAIFSVNIMLPTLTYYPIERVAKELYDNAPPYSSVVMLSEGDNFYSSALMFYLDKFDTTETRKNLFVYRPCTFFEKNSTSIIKFFKENNVYYIVAVPGEEGYEKLDGVKSILIQVRGGYVEIYKIKDFKAKARREYCNHVCLIEEDVCTSHKDPFEAISIQSNKA